MQFLFPSSFTFLYLCLQASPNNNFIAYAEDTKGDEIYTVYVIDADNGTFIGEPLKGVTSNIEWAGDDTLVYITMDEILRPDKVTLLRFCIDSIEWIKLAQICLHLYAMMHFINYCVNQKDSLSLSKDFFFQIFLNC